MATHDLKALTRRWFEEVWNNQRPEAVDELFAANAKGYGLNVDDQLGLMVQVGAVTLPQS